jgi:hypothetical protein
MPQAREFDGIDLAALLFAPDKERTNSSAHAQLFHPLSGACGSGTLMAARIGRHKALWISGGAAACGDVKAPCITHDPPLLFDLQEDPAESRPLDPTTAANRALVQRLTKARAFKIANIMGSPRSTADYSTSAAGRAANCCNAKNVDCACNSTVCDATPRRFALYSFSNRLPISFSRVVLLVLVYFLISCFDRVLLLLHFFIPCKGTSLTSMRPVWRETLQAAFLDGHFSATPWF